ncbi:hypothetical protein [Thermanaeromonas sp. C210]|uniref:hypothetical protein n=1 Tax=Thermanaeromonas sp. C210 TaxID=2731925 RepID=UPI00155C2541|nr:hypothetical protein [Thermanaeromonas sp. C210]GFN22836.1 cytochrome b subunit of the bc complex [Thermanaeromonas sp. C210]
MEQQMEQRAPKGSIPFYPHHFMAELALALGFIGLVLFLAGIAPRELRPPANPIMTPAHIKPEWYFLWVYGLLKVVPQLLGLAISALVFLALFLLPWLDRSPHRRPEERPKVIIGTLLVLIGLVVLTYVGLR